MAKYIYRNYGDNCFWQDSPTKRYDRYHSSNNISIYNLCNCNHYSMPTTSYMPCTSFNYGLGFNCCGGGLSLACGPFAMNFNNNNFGFALGPLSMSFGSGGLGFGFGNYSTGYGMGGYDMGGYSMGGFPMSYGMSNYGLVNPFGLTNNPQSNLDEKTNYYLNLDTDKKNAADNNGSGSASSPINSNNYNDTNQFAGKTCDDIFSEDNKCLDEEKFILYLCKNNRADELNKYIYKDDSINPENLEKVLDALSFATCKIDYDGKVRTCLKLPNAISENTMQLLKIISDATGYPIAFAHNENPNIIDSYIVGKIENETYSEGSKTATFTIDCKGYGMKEYQNTYANCTFNEDTLTVTYNGKDATYTIGPCATRDSEEALVSKQPKKEEE